MFKKVTYIFISLFILVSCSSKKKTTNQFAKPGDATVFGIYTSADSTKTAAIMFRRIVKTIAYDSVKRQEFISIDTLWGLPKFLNLPLTDTSGKSVLDSTGKPVIDTRPTYFLISKDSVRWKNIEGIPMDSLLRKNAPLRG